jgi:hypothetical protein
MTPQYSVTGRDRTRSIHLVHRILRPGLAHLSQILRLSGLSR